MTDQSDNTSAPKTAAAVLSELVARKAAARASRPAAGGSAKAFERAAAAQSASKSKPARRY